MTTTYAGTSTGTLADGSPAGTAREHRLARGVFAALRIVVGFTFLWAFLDKLFGLGYATPSERSWLNGGSPTRGFLANSASGPFEGLYKDIAGAAWADWLFMLGLAAIGTALLLGIGMRIAAAAGALLYVLMWTVVLPPENNPVLDDHLIGALAVTALALVHAGDTFGLGRWWKRQPIVKDNHWLV
jgi:thiosulfate dehydrogenase [quinone] large subunit